MATYVLVAGAWAGAWNWRRVARGPFADYPDRLSALPGWRIVTVHAGANLLLDAPDLVVEALAPLPA